MSGFEMVAEIAGVQLLENVYHDDLEEACAEYRKKVADGIPERFDWNVRPWRKD